ncbi:hypothetical protein SETIT_9G358100v2 [Setaria italica]|uniref:Uncharacterized protein n=1 Tax=Setaria italica TaxID=4555 RepID=A0A368SP96_SETIT|nr:hypothetical protein SETIT_9G358100v2 [Setaria italica]
MTLAAASLLLPHISRNLASTSKDVSFSDESYKANIASEAPSFCLHCGEIQFCCLELKEGTSSLFSVCLILIGGC